jgi:hypothetical protein
VRFIVVRSPRGDSSCAKETPAARVYSRGTAPPCLPVATHSQHPGRRFAAVGGRLQVADHYEDVIDSGWREVADPALRFVERFVSPTPAA